VIEPALYFLLGFLSAGLLALMIAPAIWSRAVRLTRRRIEASQPLTLAEIKADRDQLRADFAVTSRRLELNIADLRTRAANQRIEVSRTQAERDAALAEKERLAEDVRVYERELSSRGQGLSQMRDDLHALQADLDQRNQFINSLEVRIRELSAEIDSSRLEIAALTTRLETAGSQSDGLAEARRLVEARVINLSNEIERRGTVIAEERERAERLLAELNNLRQNNRLSSRQSTAFEQTSQAAHDDNERPAISRLEAENAALETRLRELAIERDKLSAELEAARVRDLSLQPDASDVALLKDRLGDIAARIAHMAAERDGPKSPVDLLVANDVGPATGSPGHGQDTDRDHPPGAMPGRLDTLAEKIHALREAASANEQA
jgi:chromosome segregation ATPase